MLTFFRRIRRRLLGEGKFANYIAYALGEIVLVVIGILIALQVNNWNESRKEYKSELKLVKAFYNELEQNLSYSDSIGDINRHRVSATMTLLSLTRERDTSLSTHAFDSILLRAFLFPSYSAPRSHLDRILKSNRIENLRSTSLQEELLVYNSSLEESDIAYNYAQDDFKLMILPYFQKHYPLRDLVHSYGLNVDASIHEADPNTLIEQVEFENILITILADAAGQVQSIDKSQGLMQKLRETIERDYPERVHK